MDKPRYYINGLGNISPQKTYDEAIFLSEISTYDQNVLTCVTPEFKQYINPIQLRRLSRLLRIGLSAATICLRDSNVNKPDGIITGTGYGFLSETYKFLTEILQQQESKLTPTYFMQSTYNALAGLVALSIKCEGYNNTFVSRGFAYENSLVDAMLKIAASSHANYLVGAFDEAAEVQYQVTKRYTHYKRESIPNLDLFKHPTQGTIQGEGAAFFMLSGEPSDSTWCVLRDIDMVYRPDDADELKTCLDLFLSKHDLSFSDIDVWIDGSSGDVLNDVLLASLKSHFDNRTVHLRFKHLCGEYCTASAFATWLAANILKRQHIPPIVMVQPNQAVSRLHRVLIVNHYMNTSYSFQLLESIS